MKNSLSHAEGGHNKFRGSFYEVVLSLSHTDGGHKKFPTIKSGGGGGGRKSYPVLRGGGVVYNAC